MTSAKGLARCSYGLSSAHLESVELDLRLLVGRVRRRCCNRSGCRHGWIGSREDDWVGGQHVNVIESKFGRAVAVVRGGSMWHTMSKSCPSVMGHRVQPLIDRGLLEISDVAHARNRWRVGVLLEYRIRLRFRECKVNWRVRRMVHVALRAIVFMCRGALEFVCDALDFQNLPIGDSKTLLHILPISRLREFAIDAERFLLYARLAVCVEVALDRVACIR